VSEQTGTAPQQEGNLAKSLGIMAAATASPDAFEDVRRPGLPREQLIGSGPELSHHRVMTVVVEDYLSIFKGISNLCCFTGVASLMINIPVRVGKQVAPA
jgi:hypothetical protein